MLPDQIGRAPATGHEFAGRSGRTPRIEPESATRWPIGENLGAAARLAAAPGARPVA